MGVDGLTKYANVNRLYSVVDLQEMANDFKRRNISEPVIAVDGSQCAWYLYDDKIDFICGGQYKEFRERCEQFVKRFRGMGYRLSFFFDGLPVEEKVETWLKRRQDKAKEISKLFAKLREAKSKGDDHVGNEKRFLPEGVVPCATVTFKELGCEIRLSTTDCDTELAQYAASNRFCVGVLSNDSDFLIYPDIPCLLTFSNLQMGRNVTGRRFRSVDVASHLGIEVDDLPIFASFVGNDIVRRESLQLPHQNLRRLFGNKEVPKLVAELLSRLPRGDLRRMCELTFGGNWRDGYELVQKSVRSYRYDVEVPDVARNASRWDAVLQHIEVKHVSCEIPGYVYTIMKCRLMKCGDVLEDLSTSRPYSPPTTQVSRAMLARMYTVLLWDSGSGPFRVTEYMPTGLGVIRPETVEVQKRLPEGVHHPGLLELWSGPEDRRWRLFTWVISPVEDLSGLRTLSPQYLVVPTAALLYLYREARVLTRGEVRTFAIVAVSVRNYPTQKLSNLRINIPDERTVYLATLFVRTVLNVLDVAGACGLSPRFAKCHLEAYFDGKLFHYMCSMPDTRALATLDESGKETFRQIMNMIE